MEARRLTVDSGFQASLSSNGFQFFTSENGSLKEWEKMRAKFNLPPTETLIDDFSAAIYKQILLHGRLYLSQHFLCFYSNLFGYQTQEVIPLEKITALEKRLINLINPGVLVYVEESKTKYEFASFVSRDTTFNILQYVLWNLDRSSSLRRRMVSLQSVESQGLRASQASDEYRLRRRSSECSSACSTCSSDELSDYYSEDGSEGGSAEGRPGASRDAAAAPSAPPHSEPLLDGPHSSPVLGTGDGVHFLSGQHPYSEVIAGERFSGVRDADAFFNAFFGEGSEFLLVYHRLRGDVDVKVQAWKAHPHFGLVRDVSFSSPVKSPFGARMAQVHETHRLIRVDRNALDLELASITTGVPFGDHFRVESRWTIRAHESAPTDGDEPPGNPPTSSPPSSSASSLDNGESGSASAATPLNAPPPLSPRAPAVASEAGAGAGAGVGAGAVAVAGVGSGAGSRRASRAEAGGAAAHCTLSIVVGVHFTKSTYGWLKGKIEETAMRESACSYQALVSHMSDWLSNPPDPRTRAALAGTLLPPGSGGVAVGAAATALHGRPPVASPPSSPQQAPRGGRGGAGRRRAARGGTGTTTTGTTTRGTRTGTTARRAPPPTPQRRRRRGGGGEAGEGPRRRLPSRSGAGALGSRSGSFTGPPEPAPPGPAPPGPALPLPPPAPSPASRGTRPAGSPRAPAASSPERAGGGGAGARSGARGGAGPVAARERLLLAGLVAAFLSILSILIHLQLRSTAGLHSRVDLLELLLARTVAPDAPPRYPQHWHPSAAPACSAFPAPASPSPSAPEPWPGQAPDARGPTCGH
eukprot:tig00000980_g6146.t1